MINLLVIKVPDVRFIQHDAHRKHQQMWDCQQTVHALPRKWDIRIYVTLS